MKVLLCQDVDKLGWYGEVVNVADGYARNYLLPYGIATVPTDEKIESMAAERARRAEERQHVLEQLVKIAEDVNDAEVVIAANANAQGHLFGSVTEKDIAENLRNQGYEIKESMVALGSHIKEVGTHEVKLKVAQGVPTKISVVVVSQDENIESDNEETSEESVD